MRAGGCGCGVHLSAAGQGNPEKESGKEVSCVWGLGFRVQGLGCRVQGLGFRVEGSRSRFEGLGFGILGLGFRI